MRFKKYYLWVDTETAGLQFDSKGNKLNGDLMELSAILTDDMFNSIFEKDWLVKYNDKMCRDMPKDIYNLHKNNNLINECKKSKLTCTDIDNKLSNLIRKYTKENDVIMLAGNSVYCDKEVIRRNCPKLFSLLYYRVFDVSSVKELLLSVNPQVVYKAENRKKYIHRALPDIKESIDEFKDYWVAFAGVTSLYR